jgi:transmembrane sensor
MDFDSQMLHRYFKGVYSEEELSKIKSIFADPARRAALEKHFSDHLEAYFEQNEAGEKLEYVFDIIQHQIRSERYKTRKEKVFVFVQRVAAIIIIPVILAVLIKSECAKVIGYNNHDYCTEIYTPPGVRSSFDLPDGTTGFLNGNSSLRYLVGDDNSRNAYHFRRSLFRSIS